MARRPARWVPLALSLVLLVGLGLFGFSLVQSSNDAAEQALGEGAVDKQRTVSLLTDQYLQLAAKRAFDVDVAHPFELTPNSSADEAVLRQLIEETGGVFDQGATLASLDGQPLTEVGVLPPASDPGYAPMRAGLVRGGAGVSSVMRVEDAPVVAVGVPVLRDGAPAAVLVAGFRADDSALQRYSEKLGVGTEAVGMVLDGDGTIVAARHPELVGTTFADARTRDRLRSEAAGHVRLDRDGTEYALTWAPIPTGGWTLVEQVPAASFYASARDQSTTARLLLLGLLVVAGLVAILLDHRAARARRRGARRAEALVRDAHDVITIVRDGVVDFASPAMASVLGYDPDDVIGRVGLDLIHPGDLSRVEAAVTAAADQHGDRQRLQARVARADGTYCACELVISNQRDDPAVRGTVVSMRDITELVALHDQLSHQALHDPLTELPNRTQLERRLQEAVTPGHGPGRVAVLFVDLDGFKAVNDDLGHDRGDELLVQVAGRLQHCVRDGDVVARLGGDEFVIVVRTDTPERDGAVVATRILDLLDRPFRLGEAQVRLGASIGIAVGDTTSVPERLLREADAAMYVAKDRGRLRYEFAGGALATDGAGAVAAPAGDEATSEVATP